MPARHFGPRQAGNSTIPSESQKAACCKAVVKDPKHRVHVRFQERTPAKDPAPFTFCLSPSRSTRKDTYIDGSVDGGTCVQLCRATNRKTVHKLSKTLLVNLEGVRRCSDADKHRKNETIHWGFV